MTEANGFEDYLPEGERALEKIDSKSILLLETHSRSGARNSAYPNTKKLSNLCFTEKRMLIKTAKEEVIQMSYEEVRDVEYKKLVSQIVLNSFIPLITFFLPTATLFFLYTASPDRSAKTLYDLTAMALAFCAIATIYFFAESVKGMKLRGIYIRSKYASESQDGNRMIKLIGKQEDINRVYKSLKERIR